MITIISGTNRAGSRTRIVAQQYSSLLKAKGEDHQFITLEDLPRDFAFTYFGSQQSEEYKNWISTHIGSADKFVFVAPEYNGSYPGILKMFIDSIHPSLLRGKKAALVGVADGRGGNLRGLDQLSGAFHYLGITVLPKHVMISGVGQLILDNQLTDPAVNSALEAQSAELIKM
jgi:NAD(P)H-dependent FMN reductase